MPNPLADVANPYARMEIFGAATQYPLMQRADHCAGTGTKFVERGGADLLTIYSSGCFLMAGLMTYGDTVAMETGEFAVFPAVGEIPIICNVYGPGFVQAPTAPPAEGQKTGNKQFFRPCHR